MERSLSALHASELKIVEERKDGSGVVDFPILHTIASLDISRTATRDGEGFDSITVADLESAVANFAKWPGPMPIFRAPHRTLSESQGKSPGFFDKIWIDGDQLWARADLTASLFQEVKGREWRGFSVDYGRGATMATGRLDGFLIAGGVFTNRPAADVHFKVAASGVESISDHGSLFTSIGGKAEEINMEKIEDVKVSLATAEAKVESHAGTIASLTTKLEESKREADDFEKKFRSSQQQVASLSAEVSSLRVQVENKRGDVVDSQETISSLEAKNKELKAKLEEQVNESLGAKVLALCKAAVKDGVPPAKIKELGDFEKDPVRWLTGNFVSIETASLFLKSLPRDAALSAARKGEKVSDADDKTETMGADRIENLRGLGLNPKLAGVARQSQLEELVEAGQLKKK